MEGNDFKLFVGVWRLVHSVTVKPDGTREYPFGQDAVGYIYYHDTGTMAVQISRAARQSQDAVDHLHHDYLAYFGRFKVDAPRCIVQHVLEGQLFVDHAPVVERRYVFDGDIMRLTPVDAPHREIAWKRVR